MFLCVKGKYVLSDKALVNERKGICKKEGLLGQAMSFGPVAVFDEYFRMYKIGI